MEFLSCSFLDLDNLSSLRNRANVPTFRDPGGHFPGPDLPVTLSGPPLPPFSPFHIKRAPQVCVKLQPTLSKDGTPRSTLFCLYSPYCHSCMCFITPAIRIDDDADALYFPNSYLGPITHTLAPMPPTTIAAKIPRRLCLPGGHLKGATSKFLQLLPIVGVERLIDSIPISVITQTPGLSSGEALPAAAP